MVENDRSVTVMGLSYDAQAIVSCRLLSMITQGQVEAASHPKDEETPPRPAPGGSGPTKLPPRQEVYISTRSVLEMMFYLCPAIDVPTEQIEQGLVTVTLDDNGEPFAGGRRAEPQNGRSQWTQNGHRLLSSRVPERRILAGCGNNERPVTALLVTATGWFRAGICGD